MFFIKLMKSLDAPCLCSQVCFNKADYLCALFMLSGVLACSLTLLSVHGLYSASDDVVELNPSNFNREVIQSDSLWLVEFYAPW